MSEPNVWETEVSSKSRQSAADLGDVGSVFDRYQGAPRRCLALDIQSRFTGEWQTILKQCLRPQ